MINLGFKITYYAKQYTSLCGEALVSTELLNIVPNPGGLGRMIAAGCVQEAESSNGHGRGSETVSVSTQGCLLLFWCRSAEMKSHLNVKRFSKLNLLFFCVTTFAITKLTEMVK